MDGASGPIRYPFAEAPAEGEVVEIAEGVLWMRLPLPMALDHVNIYALDDGDGWTLIDTGLSSRRGRAIWERLLSGPLTGRPVRRVVVTHHHPDHVGLAGWFQSVHGAETVTTRTSWLFARMLQLDAQDVPTEESLAFWRGAGMPAEMIEARKRERPFNYCDTVWPLPLGFTKIAEGESLIMGGRTWDIRLTSGHAPDQATFWSRDDGLVLGADQLLPSISPNLGVYVTEPLADPVADWIAGLTRLKPFAREDQLVLPGHKLPYTGLPARIDQLIENHVSALDRLRDWLAESPRTAHDCFPPLFKREIGGGEYGLALVEAVAHLNRLLHGGEATRRLGGEGAWLWELTE